MTRITRGTEDRHRVEMTGWTKSSPPNPKKGLGGAVGVVLAKLSYCCGGGLQKVPLGGGE